LSQLLVTVNVVLGPPILGTLMMGIIISRATRRYIPEEGILHSHRRGMLKSYIALAG
jgi:hypothetical protein